MFKGIRSSTGVWKYRFVQGELKKELVKEEITGPSSDHLRFAYANTGPALESRDLWLLWKSNATSQGDPLLKLRDLKKQVAQ